MTKLTGLFSAAILLSGCLAVPGPALAKDDVGVDVDGLCQAAFNICADTCNLTFGGPGFSNELKFDLCMDSCSSNLRACTSSDDGVILRQNSRGKDAIKKLRDKALPTLSD